MTYAVTLRVPSSGVAGRLLPSGCYLRSAGALGGHGFPILNGWGARRYWVTDDRAWLVQHFALAHAHVQENVHCFDFWRFHINWLPCVFDSFR